MRTRRCYKWRMRRSQRRLRWLLFIVAATAWWAAAAQGPAWLRLIGVAGAAWLLLTTGDKHRIPVLTYHSVSARGRWLREPGLVMTTDSFETQLKWLRKHGYRTMNMDELIHFRSQATHGGKSVVLTFDDGYVDAWVAVAPLLKCYGFKGTVFVSSGWIEDGDVARAQMDHAAEQDLQWEGYLNRAEVRLLKQKEVLDVQSHGVSHDRFFADQPIPEQTLVRWKDELQSSKEVLEEITGRSIDHFCWPRSAWQPEGEALALEVGYRSTTNGDGHNGPNTPWRVSRVHVGGIGRPVIDLWRFVLEIQVFRGRYWLWPLLWLLQKAMARKWRIRKRRLL